MNEFVSLYAVAYAKIEVGRYGMSLRKAKESFLEAVARNGCVVRQVQETKSAVRISLAEGREGMRANRKLLGEVADVLDLKGDAPSEYVLVTASAIEGEYIKTGMYAD